MAYEFHVNKPNEIGKRKDRISSKELRMAKDDLNEGGMIKLKDLLEVKKLTDADIKIGDSYYSAAAGNDPWTFVYGKKSYGWITVDWNDKPNYGAPFFAGVGSGPPEGVNDWGRKKKKKVSSSVKKEMIKALEAAIKSKHPKGSEETEVLIDNGLRLSNVLSWVKRL
jgi:hypothetical protein|tara:strand:- start:134 stop:634 length:501 start_codon:yes stop_codon:yes gene_type:complete